MRGWEREAEAIDIAFRGWFFTSRGRKALLKEATQSLTSWKVTSNLCISGKLFLQRQCAWLWVGVGERAMIRTLKDILYEPGGRRKFTRNKIQLREATEHEFRQLCKWASFEGCSSDQFKWKKVQIVFSLNRLLTSCHKSKVNFSSNFFTFQSFFRILQLFRISRNSHEIFSQLFNVT